MNFKYYDLMSSLVSGVLVAISVNIIYDLAHIAATRYVTP